MRTLTLLLMLVSLGACATTTPQLVSEVSTYGQWTAARTPTTYAFERLPSQQRWRERQQQFEDAARGALETAGFTEAADANEADVLVQVGARIGAKRAQISSVTTRHKPRTPEHDFSVDPVWVTIELREVALLIRERQSGQTLYGTRATNRGRSVSSPEILAAMFDAAMSDFPNATDSPRQVTVDLNR
jgi:hypothetical protein